MRKMTLGDVAEYVNGRAFKPEEWEEDGKPILRIQNLTNSTEVCHKTTRTYESKYFVQSGDLLFAWSASLGAYIWQGGDAWLNQHIFKVMPFAFMEKKYLFYYLVHMIDELYEKTHGSAMVHITRKTFQSMPIPVPPLAEQQRIVERIEGLFSKLDAARENAQSVLDGAATRKAAILHRAFSGDLTRQWREDNGLSDSERKTVTVASVCHSLKYGTAKKSAKTGNVVVLRMGNLQGGEIDWSNLAYSNDEEDNEKYSLSPGDVLFNRTNSPELVGKTSIYRGEFPAIYAGYLIKLDYNRDIISGEYLNYMLNSPEAKEYCKAVKTDGVNQSNINAKRIGAFLIPLPSLQEQEETAKRLQSILRKELQASEAARQVLDNIDAMKRVILGRAFRGELGTNRPSEAAPEASR